MGIPTRNVARPGGQHACGIRVVCLDYNGWYYERGGVTKQGSGGPLVRLDRCCVWDGPSAMRDVPPRSAVDAEQGRSAGAAIGGVINREWVSSQPLAPGFLCCSLATEKGRQMLFAAPAHTGHGARGHRFCGNFESRRRDSPFSALVLMNNVRRDNCRLPLWQHDGGGAPIAHRHAV